MTPAGSRNYSPEVLADAERARRIHEENLARQAKLHEFPERKKSWADPGFMFDSVQEELESRYRPPLAEGLTPYQQVKYKGRRIRMHYGSK